MTQRGRRVDHRLLLRLGLPLILILLLLVAGNGCSGKDKKKGVEQAANHPKTVKLSSEDEGERVYRMDANTVRVLSYGIEPELGQHAAFSPTNPGLLVKPHSKHPDETPIPIENINMEGFRLYDYSSEISVVENAGGAYAVFKADEEVKVFIVKRKYVLEWSRYLNLSLNGNEEQVSGNSGPFVSAVDLGIALRVIFDVSVQTTDAKMAFGFGFGQIMASLVSNTASVSVSYEIIGASPDFLPQQMPGNVESARDFVKIQEEFYGNLKKLSTAMENLEKTKCEVGALSCPEWEGWTPPCSCEGRDGKTPVVPRSALGVIAYYVTNFPENDEPAFVGYLLGVRLIADGSTCKESTKIVDEAICQGGSNSAETCDSVKIGLRLAYSNLTEDKECGERKVLDGEQKHAAELAKLFSSITQTESPKDESAKKKPAAEAR